MTDENVMKAIQYGIAAKQDKKTTPQFMAPWMISEKLQKNPYRQKESVVFYTPYLLSAIHARDKVEDSRMPEVQEIKAAVREYDGITLLGARINAPVVLKEGEYTVKLVQGKTSAAPYATNFLSWEMLDVPITEPEAAAQAGPDDGKQLRVSEKGNQKPARMQKVAVLDFQFYFDSSQFAPGQKFTLVFSDKYCGERNFDITPESIQ